MSYSKKTWVTGETVKAEYLNNMENGIKDNSTNIANETSRATQAEKSIRDSIPTKTSDLSNDSGYKTTDTNTTYTLTKEGNQIVLTGSDGSKSNVTDNSGTTDLSNYYTKGETYNQGQIDSKLNSKASVSDLNEVVNSFATKVDVADNYYNKSQTYNKIEIDTKIASAGSGGTVDLSNYVDKSSSQTITGKKEFTGNVGIYGQLWDKNATQGKAGQILSSTGTGVEWINAPTTDLSNYYTKGETYNQDEIEQGFGLIAEQLEQIINNNNQSIENQLATKVNKNDLNNYYKKNETYTKYETDDKIEGKVNQKASQSDLNALANRVTVLETNSGGGNATSSEYAEKLGNSNAYVQMQDVRLTEESEETIKMPVIIYEGDVENGMVIPPVEYTQLLINEAIPEFLDVYLPKELSNYVDKSSQQTITGRKDFTGNVGIYGQLWDKNATQGKAGQILSSNGNGVEWINAPSGGTTDLSNYYTKTQVDTELLKKANAAELNEFTDHAEATYLPKITAGNTYATKSNTYTKTEVDNKINVAIFDLQEGVENEIIPRLTYSKSEIDSKIANAGGDSAYVRVNERITLSSPSTEGNCQTLYIKVGEGMSPGDREPIGYFNDETDVLFYIDGYVEIDGEQFSCEMVETDVYSVVLPNAMSGAYITPETDTSNRAYFVNQVGEETKAPLGKDYGYTLRLERGDVELDINKVYTLNASHWDNQEKPCFVLTDNGEPLKVDKVYTFKVIDFFLPQWVNDEYINIAELFRIKLAGGLTERGSGGGRTFMWSGENGQNYSVNNCHIDKGYDITGIVEITFYTDDTASCYIYLSPFATAEQ